MDLISLYYFQELSKDLNMTKTAERLYISQQTLSNHIQRLEQYYGTKLFYRWSSITAPSCFTGSPPCPSPARGSSCCPLPRWWGRRSGT